MDANTDVIRAALASLVGATTPTHFGFNVSSSPRSPQPSRQHQQQHAPPPQQQQQQQQEQPLSSVKDALMSIREKLLSLQTKQQLQQETIKRQTMAVFSGCPSPVQQSQSQEEHQQQPRLQEQPNPLHAVAINAQELERIQQQQQMLVSFLHRRLQLESQQQHKQQSQQQQQHPHAQHQLRPQQLQRRDAGPQLSGGPLSSNSSLPGLPRSTSSMAARNSGWEDTAARQQSNNSVHRGEESNSTSAPAMAPAGRVPQMQLLQNGDYTTLQMLKAAKQKPKVEGVCFDKFFRRWVSRH